MRRLIIEEPVSRAALWSSRIAWFALAVTLIALAFTRFRIVEPLPGLVALAAGLLLALTAVGFALLAFLRIWMEGRRGVPSATKGLLLALVVLAYPGWFAVKAVTLPPLNDISTDVEDPPAFSRSRAALDARGGRMPPEIPVELRRLQRDAYPDIASLTLDIPPNQVFELAMEAARRRGWEIVDAVRPGGRVGLGRVDAVDRTFLLRLADDITVRIRPRADGARIDVRSASRIGTHDLGQNAKRIRRFLEEVSDLAVLVQ